MTMGHPIRPHHSRRFYIFLTTVVVGAILILTLINDGESRFDFLTGSSIGLDEAEEQILEEELRENGEIEAYLNFDIVPEVEEKTELGSLRVIFDDLNTKIKINEEELELKGLEMVEMEVNDFDGDLSFDDMSVSLKGEGKVVVVNGIEISGKEKMDISFSNLVYESLELEGVELSLLDFEEGSGELLMEGKLDYKLDNEAIELTGFEGNMMVGVNNESLVTMEGKVNGVSVEGEFDLTLG